MEQKLGFSLTVRDPASGQPVTIRMWGTASHHGGEANPGADHAVSRAVNNAATGVISGALGAQQVALPTLEMSLPHFTPQIVQQANAELGAAGIQLTSVVLQCTVPPAPQMAAASAAIAAAPSALESAASNLVDNAVASNVPSHVNVNVGGFNVGVGADGPSAGGLADQAADKVKGQLLHYAIIGGVFLFVSFICCGAVAFKFLF